MASDIDRDDVPELTDEMAARLRPAEDVLPPAATRVLSRGGRPPKPAAERKQPVSIRLSPRVLKHFAKGSDGWQTRISEVLEREVDRAGKPG